MKRRLLALCLCAVLFLSGNVAAKEGDSPFVRTKTYEDNFSDLTVDSVFHDNVVALWEYGLSVGKADGTYDLKGSVKLGEVVIFAARMCSLYETGDAETGPSTCQAELEEQEDSDPADLYQPYTAYLLQEGVIDRNFDETLTEPATRAQVAHLLAHALPKEWLPRTCDELITRAYASQQFITDVTEYTPYYQDILTLYRCGISIGSDSTGTYYPEAEISRGALAAMLTRMADSDLRVKPDWSVLPPNSAVGTEWGDLIFDKGTYSKNPVKKADVAANVHDMLRRGEYEMHLDYDMSITDQQAQQVMDWSLEAVKQDCEQMYNEVSCTYEIYGGTVDLLFSANKMEPETVQDLRADTMAMAIAVHDELWSNGAITTDMTETERARVYFKWICDHCAYDYQAGDTSPGHLAHAVFADGIAVCDGYTGAYNLLLKLDGIDCYALSNENHIWTVCMLDGTEVHSDVTWGDTTYEPDWTMFAMTAEESELRHNAA